MIVKPFTALPPDVIEPAWQLYTDCFEPLNHLAVNRHLMYRHEFDHLAADTRIDKYVTFTDTGAVAGLATLTRDLNAVPLVSPAYFAHHYPELYRTSRIWYIPFFAVAPEHRTSDAFQDVLRTFYHQVSAEDGLIFLDVCTHNEEKVRLVRMIDLTLKRITGNAVRTHKVDTQSFFGFDVNGVNAVVFP